jgi:hypothetical protein
MCDVAKGRKLPCKDQKGGIKALYFANYDAYGFTIANSIGFNTAFLVFTR